MSSDIYEQHDKAFADVNAYVVLDGTTKERVATIAFKTSKGGTVSAYVHWLGLEMVKGRATGFGYDKRTAACALAVRKMREALVSGWDHLEFERRFCALFVETLAKDGGEHWDNALRRAGFIVWQAV